MNIITGFSITPSIVLEYLYCPRFIYFMKVLDIPQNEETRYKVQEGRNVHKYKTTTNKDYLRKKLKVIKKEIDCELYSKKYKIHGKVDEILFFEDDTASPLDYKFAEYKDKIYKTYRIQSVMYGLMIMDNYNLKVSTGYLVYTRSRNKIVSFDFSNNDFDEVNKIIDNLQEIILSNYYPERTKVKSRCLDCCYRNICTK